MASRIKGITVEIGGDATGLEKALKNVNSTIKSIQSELKDVERLLKLDPSNTELLTQKQKLLKDAISSTSEKLETRKEAQKQAKEQLENGELGQDKYDALQRELIETDDFEETEQACACSVSYSAKESALRNSLGNSSFNLLHQRRKHTLNVGKRICLTSVGCHIQPAVNFYHDGAYACVAVQVLQGNDGTRERAIDRHL